MAYMNQEQKARIAARLKEVMPKDWKYSLAVRHHSTIVLNIRSAPVDLIGHITKNNLERNPLDGWAATQSELRTYWDVNHYHLEHQFKGELLEVFKAIVEALNNGNWDHYVDLNIGQWDKPFINTKGEAA